MQEDKEEEDPDDSMDKSKCETKESVVEVTAGSGKGPNLLKNSVDANP